MVESYDPYFCKMGSFTNHVVHAPPKYEVTVFGFRGRKTRGSGLVVSSVDKVKINHGSLIIEHKDGLDVVSEGSWLGVEVRKVK